MEKHIPLFLLIAICGAGCFTPPGTKVLSTTQSGIGIRFTVNPANQTPDVEIGYFRTQYHLVPTSKVPIYVPAVSSTIDVSARFSHTAIKEEFNTFGVSYDSGPKQADVLKKKVTP